MNTKGHVDIYLHCQSAYGSEDSRREALRS
jgi:hypothetical protein